MKRVIVLTHGELCLGFLSAYEVISGEKDAFTAIPMYPHDSPEEMEKKLRSELAKANSDDNIILITDIPAGSTTKTAIPFLEEYSNLYIVSGINFGLLLEIMMNPMDTDIEDAIKASIEQSSSTIQFINDVFKQM